MLIPEAETVTVPVENFDNIPPPVTEGEQVSGKGIKIKMLLYQYGKPVYVPPPSFPLSECAVRKTVSPAILRDTDPAVSPCPQMCLPEDLFSESLFSWFYLEPCHCEYLQNIFLSQWQIAGYYGREIN